MLPPVPKQTLVRPGLIPVGRGIPRATTERVASGFTHEEKHQHPGQGELVGIPELIRPKVNQ